MPPKRGELAKKTVIDLLLSSSPDPADANTRLRLDTANKNWLLDEAERRGILSPDATKAARETRNVVLKRYLRTCLRDGPTLEALDAYVRMASDVRSAGSQLLNLFAIHAFDVGWFDGCHVVDSSGAVLPAGGRPAASIVEATLQDQTFLKYALLPFKSVLSNRQTDGCPAALRAVWEVHRAVLEPKYPSVGDLSRMAWDQALTDMAREMAGAIKSHVMVHLGDRTRAYLRCRVVCDLGGVVSTVAGRKACSVGGSTFHLADMYEALDSGQTADLPDVVRAEVAALRERLGLGGASRLSKLTKLTDGVFRLHVELSRDAERRRAAAPAAAWSLPRAFSALPVVRTGRTFAYVDDRVMEALVRGFGLDERRLPGERLFESMLGVGREDWDSASKAARRRRRRARAASGARKRRKPRRRDPGWARRPDPKTWTATSAATDGVAVCLTLTSPVPPQGPVSGASPDAAGVPKVPRELRHAIAADPGRVIIYEAAQRCPDGSWRSSRLSRAAYLKLSCQLRRDEAEARRRQERPELREAIEVLSARTWKTTDGEAFLAMVGVHAGVLPVLRREYVEDETYAKWRMLLWRRKRSTLMRSLADTISAVAPRGSKVTFGLGNAKFAPTGRGERAVPTTTVGKTLLRTARCLGRSYDVEVVPIDEARTTMCCHGCGAVLEDVRDGQGAVLRGLKACRTASCREAKRHTLGASEEACGGCGAANTSLRDENGEAVSGLTICCHRRTCGGAEIEGVRLRNRDKNAARNIWAALDAQMRGEQRPEYLRRVCRYPRAMRRGTSLPSVPRASRTASTSRGR